MENVYNALTVLILAGVFLIFALGILALTYAQKIRKSWDKDQNGLTGDLGDL